jgi:adenosylhomocysteine nucleosidase
VGDVTGLLVVVGMASESRIARGARTVIGGLGVEAILAERPTAILSFGLCGGLDPALRVGDLVAGDGDTAWTAALAAVLPVKRAAFASGPEIIATCAAKTALRTRTGAGAADMESHLAREAATRLGVPLAIVRAVSDGADDDLPVAAQAGFSPDGSTNIGAVLTALARRPWELPALIRTARNAGRALAALEAAWPTVSAVSAPYATGGSR